MNISVVRPRDLGAAETARWRELQKASPSLDNPFLSVEFALAMDRLRDYVHVAVIEDGGRIQGFFPFERHSFGIGKPLGGFLTTCHGLISVPELKLDARTLLRACKLSVFDFDHLVAGQPTFAPYESDVRPAPIMDLSAGFEPWIEQVRINSPKNLKTVRYKERKLGREHGEIRFEWDSRDRATLRTLMNWKSDQYRRTGRVDRFAQPWIVQLLDECHDLATEDFAGVLTMVYSGDTPVAGHFGLRTATTLVGWFPAYDTEFARYSPGIMHHLHMAEHAANAGLQQVDMGKGGREYKSWLKNGALLVAEGRVSRPSAAAAVHWVGRAPVNKARTIVTDRPQLYRLADRVLKGFGRVRTSVQQDVPPTEPSGAR
ncbi:CelD/BcsL family acetyltransferase involved in cellulose biosynthesis [Thermocatellispora tengchongensis]|uniref:CelD/BcsL family acetyltransferase involved in cellulose biosynthesis n=1 Tax=Thermocatellispora tengchongensis TaxID=1073253 RepID=A0A840PHB9_9ACTN|nr:GNAT family N-acetyltransferase [Thermocatellispora tengchongensis]MBB5136527.1 CelD/BcsL family acetyltransferase involved in cellulose biosynthesis [Thermocatellispora tengchongensis]